MKFLVLFYNKLENILKEYFGWIFGIAAFNYIPYGIVRIFLGKYKNFSSCYKIIKFILTFFEFFITTAVICLIILLLFQKIKVLKEIVIKSFFYLSFILFVIELFLLKNFNYLISPPVVQILLETNKNEAMEFLQTYLNIKTFVIVFLICFIIKILFRKNNKREKIIKEKRKSSLLMKAIKVVIAVVFLIKAVDIKSDLKIFSFNRVLKSIEAGMENIKEYKEISANLDKNIISIISNNSEIKNIILIIGESTGRKHMSLYGYPVETNPLLKKLEKSGNIYKFTDTISPHAHTIPSIKKLLTFYNFESTKKWYEYNNIIDIMKKAGYETYWFSNQESSGVYGNVSAALGSRSEMIKFTNLKSSGSESENLYDEEVVKLSDKYIKNDLNKKFIIYHLLGTHAKYRNRYPESFSVFENKNHNIAEYDNAVLYNDFVINEIISRFKNEETVLFYVSDHGEEVDDFRNFRGHSEENGSRYMVEIPFVIYFSDKFKEKYPEVIKDIEKSLNKPYMTDDLIHTILDIVQIKTEEFDETRSIINEKYNSSRKRIFSGKDYDTYWKNKN